MAEGGDKDREHGDDAPGKGDTPPQEEPRNGNAEGARASRLAARLREKLNAPESLLNNISRASMLVFVLSSISIMFILVVYTPFPIANVEVYRATQLLLTLAGAAIILGLLTKDLNAFTVVFGFLVIAALIVPTRDIIRFALIASGSEQKYGDFFPDAVGTKNQSDKIGEVARLIYEAIVTDATTGDSGTGDNKDAASSSRDSTRDARSEALSKITAILRDARDSAAFERIAQRGAVETFKALARNHKDEWIYRYSGNEDFRGNLDYLRFEGAVSFDYGDIDQLQMTRYGCTLLQKFAPVTMQESTEAYISCLRPIASSVSVKGSYKAALSVGADGVMLPFKVEAGGMYEICAIPTFENGFADPSISLLSRDETILATSDDFEGTSSSRITYRLESDVQYLLRVEDYFPIVDTAVDVSIRLPTEEDKPCEGRVEVDDAFNVLEPADVGELANAVSEPADEASATMPDAASSSTSSDSESTASTPAPAEEVTAE